jgi:predicted  nucleic acid-binding Zn-ribbon protein
LPWIWDKNIENLQKQIDTIDEKITQIKDKEKKDKEGLERIKNEFPEYYKEIHKKAYKL